MDGFPELVAGKYRLLRKLGEGGLGVVFEATHEIVGSRIALKLIRGKGVDPTVTTRALAEYRTVARLKSHHVAPVLDFGVEGDAFFIAQEFVDGEPLGKLVPLPLREALAVALGVADALADAHDNGFIHRDVKPSNVIVPRVGGGLAYDDAKLLDFGVAGLLVEEQRQGTRLTAVGQFFGTPLYMSPEQWGGGRQGPPTDVYGLGVLLYEMIFGRPPFGGQAVPEIILSILSQPVQFPQTPTLPEPVRDFLVRCLSKSMTDRPADGRVARQELARLYRTSGFLALDARATNVASAASPAQIAGFEPPRRLASPPPVVQAASAAPVPIARPDTGDIALTPAPRTSAPPRWYWLGLALASLAGTGALVVFAPRAAWLALGLAGLAGSWGLALFVHRLIDKRRPPLGSAVASLLGRATALEDLTKSLAIDVGHLVEACRQLDEKILAKTLALMIGEYDQAKVSADRQAALMKAVELMEKLNHRLSPWYVRHQALLSWGVGILGSALSTAKTAHEVLKLLR